MRVCVREENESREINQPREKLERELDLQGGRESGG